jgi:hypothetical protein
VRTSNAFLRLLCVTMGYARADPFRFYIDRDGVTESRNGVTCPPKPPPNIAIYGDTARQIVVAEVVDREVCWKVVVCVSTRAAVEMSLLRKSQNDSHRSLEISHRTRDSHIPTSRSLFLCDEKKVE